MQNKKMWLAVTAILIIALAIGVYYYFSGDKEQPTVSSTDIGVNAPAENGQVSVERVIAPEANEVSVSMSGFSFRPATVTVKKGTVVVWTNMDDIVHNVIGTDGKIPEFKSPLFGKGGTYRFAFDEVGSFAYYCSVHPSMKGTVIVEE